MYTRTSLDLSTND